jgi:hypothetical protein
MVIGERWSKNLYFFFAGCYRRIDFVTTVPCHKIQRGLHLFDSCTPQPFAFFKMQADKSLRANL